ncbi:hypothetical protein F5I97DRAFT_1234336 [Phlebopus sp. FC_14]|nr:hypothetical protein F5I97DRAFT_1234336 [Phlebopus sp. FC_14]
MLVLPHLHTYLYQLLSPPQIHTALLLTPEGALVSCACQMGGSSAAGGSGPSIHGENDSSQASSLDSTKSASTLSRRSQKPANVHIQTQTTEEPRPRSKDEIRIVAGLSAEVWVEMRGSGEGGEEGMVESELGRIFVLPVEEPRKQGNEAADGQDPLLLLALNGTLDAGWDVMSAKAHKLAAFLAPSVNKHRAAMQAQTLASSPASPVNERSYGGKSRTRSTATSPGRIGR